MKKILILVFLALLLTACSPAERAARDFEKKIDKEVLEGGNNNDIYFKENIAKIAGVKVEITNTRVIPVGKERNKGDKPLFAIWYKVTNYTDKELDPVSAWDAIYNVVQEKGSNKVNKLKMGTLPDEQYMKSQKEPIKKNGTVENAISYKLNDAVTPVTLIAKRGLNGEEIGSQEIK